MNKIRNNIGCILGSIGTSFFRFAHQASADKGASLEVLGDTKGGYIFRFEKCGQSFDFPMPRGEAYKFANMLLEEIKS